MRGLKSLRVRAHLLGKDRRQILRQVEAAEPPAALRQDPLQRGLKFGRGLIALVGLASQRFERHRLQRFRDVAVERPGRLDARRPDLFQRAQIAVALEQPSPGQQFV